MIIGIIDILDFVSYVEVMNGKEDIVLNGVFYKSIRKYSRDLFLKE